MKHISIIASVALLGLVGFSGCSGGSGGGGGGTSATTYTGISIEGYLEDATVTIDGHKATTSHTSGHEGEWTMSIVGGASTDAVVTTTGGTDISTGQPYEGQISAVVNSDGTKTVSTPITSLVAFLVQSGTTKAAAITKVANSLGVKETAITSDPVVALSDPAKQKDAQKVIKQSLVIQKVAEAFAKSLVSNSTNADFNKVTDAVFKHIADKIASGQNIATTVGDTAGIASSIVTAVTGSKITSAPAKLLAATKAIFNISTALNSIDAAKITDTTSLTKYSRAVGITTGAIEKKLIGIADSNSTTLVAAKAAATAISNNTAITDIATIANNVTKDTDVASVVKKLKATSTSNSIASDILASKQTTVKVTLTAAEAAAAQGNINATKPASLDISIVNGVIKVTPADSTVAVSKVELVNENGAIISASSIATIAIVKITNTKFLKIYMTQTVKEATVNVANNTPLDANGTINNTALQVNTIHSVIPSFNVFYVSSSKLIGSTYSAIKSNLNSLLNIKLTATDTTTTSLNADYMVTVVIKNNTTGHYLVASTKAHFQKTGANLNVTVPANNDLVLQANTADVQATVKKTNAGVNSITSSVVGGKAVVTVNVVNIIDAFSSNAQVGSTIKNTLVNYTTTPGSYDAYLLVNKISDGSSFISDTNSVKIDASTYNNTQLVSKDYGIEKAIQVHTRIY